MNPNGRKAKKQEKTNNTVNCISKEELEKRIKSVEDSMKAYSWHELETRGQFKKDEKISFISDDMLILGCDVGSEKHYLRAIDTRGRELSKKAFPFDNNDDGFQKAREWAISLAAENGKHQIVLGLEPTGHYWFCLAAWMVAHGISVVQVNPYAVKQTKEVEDNSQLKDDRKDPKVIANLVKDGNYGMPYLPAGLYAELRGLSMLRDQLMEDRIRNTNRLHREMVIFFPEYKDAFGELDAAFTLALLKEAPFPKDILALGEEGVKKIWHEAKLRGRGYSRARKIIECAKMSVGLAEGNGARRRAVQWFVKEMLALETELKAVEDELHSRCLKIPHAENLLEINGIGENTLSGILAEIGDISRFDDVKEIQKLSGLGLVECSSGKHKGETKISHRGRKRLRYWLFQTAKSAVAHADEFQSLHLYYTTRKENPLKKMQSLIVIAGKLLRVIFAILKTGQRYDPEKLLRDIRRPAVTEPQAA